MNNFSLPLIETSPIEVPRQAISLDTGLPYYQKISGESSFILPGQVSPSQVSPGQVSPTYSPGFFDESLSISPSPKPPSPGGPLNYFEVIEAFTTNYDFWTQEDKRKLLKDAGDKKSLREYDLLVQQWSKICPSSVMFNLEYSHSAINGPKLQLTVQDKFYDPTIMKEMQCLVGSLVYVPNPKNLGASAGERVRYWLKNRKWLASGSYGNVNISDFDRAKQIFAIKTSTDTKNLLHELFVGFQLNTLRNFIPNFAYVYGGFDCNYPKPIKKPKVPGMATIQDENKLRGWCWNADGKMNMISTILYENIAPSKTLKDFLLGGATFDQWLNLYLQILFALRLAYDKLEFSHNDMHLNNILVRTIKGTSSSNPNYYIPYSTNRGTEYLLTTKIATIIDYGFVHVKVGNEHFGVYNVRHFGVDPDKGRPIADAYRLLMSTFEFYGLYQKYDEFVKMKPLLKYFWSSFEDSEVENFLDMNFRKLKMALPESDKEKKLSLDGLIDYIRKNYDLTNILTDKPIAGIRIIGCTGTDICTPDINYQELGINDSSIPGLLFEFYDLHRHYTKSKQTKKADELKTKYKSRYSLLISVTTDRYKNLLMSITTYLISPNWKSITNTDTKTLGASAELVNTYRLQLISYLQIYDTLWQTVTTREIINYVNKLYGINTDIGGKDTLIKLKSILISIKQAIVKDYNHIADLSKKSSLFVRSPYYKNWIQLGDFIKNTPSPNIE